APWATPMALVISFDRSSKIRFPGCMMNSSGWFRVYMGRGRAMRKVDFPAPSRETRDTPAIEDPSCPS
ncbi:hypothetical protein, partial [Pararhodobacter sp.]|uniref:hypothetical protein n=1 Tax=Pararhodobacter sp. TaxID=2127056 RepID=UPI002D1FC0BF